MKPSLLQQALKRAFVVLLLGSFILVAAPFQSVIPDAGFDMFASYSTVGHSRSEIFRFKGFTITFETQTAPRVNTAQTDPRDAVVANAAPAVVAIRAYKDVPVYSREYRMNEDGSTTVTRTQIGTQKRQVSSGSGFLITSDGYMLTNKHVVADPIASYGVNLGTHEVIGTVVYRDPDTDLALVKIEGTNYPTIRLGDSSGIDIGERVVSIGNALGQYVDSVSKGSVVALDQDILVSGGAGGSERLNGMIQSSAKLYPGDSGGPLLDADGNAIGVNTATLVGRRVSVGYSIPIDVAKNAILKAGVQV